MGLTFGNLWDYPKKSRAKRETRTMAQQRQKFQLFINLKRVIFSLEYRENQLTGAKQMFIKNIDLKMKNENLRVQLENLLGGGFIGDMANKILTLIGEDFLYTHKDTLATAAKEAYKSIIRKILDLGKMNNSS